MLRTGHKLLSTKSLSGDDVDHLFSLTSQLKQKITTGESLGDLNIQQAVPPVVFLLFLEPSTRTRMSFETACHRLGVVTNVFSNNGNTSMVKGETVVDTLKTLESMNPDVMVVRYSYSEEVERHISNSNVSYINGGSGNFEHPTQALLDAFTLYEKWGDLHGKRILFVGDVRHSRVANSNAHLLKMLGAEIAVCSPEETLPNPEWPDWNGVERFSNLKSGLEWADACMCLRIQKERFHENSDDLRAEIISHYQLNGETAKWLSGDSLIMHPGPFVIGEEITRECIEDSRSLIWTQVQNGVYMRAAILRLLLGGS